LVGKEENDEESFEKIVSSALQDEVIAQTIG
jgi:hypothetical protein